MGAGVTEAANTRLVSLLLGSRYEQSAPLNRPVDVALILDGSRLPEQVLAAVEFLLCVGEVATRPFAQFPDLANSGFGAH